MLIFAESVVGDTLQSCAPLHPFVDRVRAQDSSSLRGSQSVMWNMYDVEGIEAVGRRAAVVCVIGMAGQGPLFCQVAVMFTGTLTSFVFYL